MSDASGLPGIDAADWAHTPQAARIPVLALSEQVGALEERTQGGSRNSSQPPSTDPPGTPVAPTAGHRAVSKAANRAKRAMAARSCRGT